MDAQDLRVKVLVGVLVFPVKLLTPTAAEVGGWMTPRETHSRLANKPISAAFRLRLPRMPVRLHHQLIGFPFRLFTSYEDHLR